MSRTLSHRTTAAPAPRLPAIVRRLALLFRCQVAAISPLFALLLIPICGSIAYAVELGGMQYVQRSAQNAADAAAIAAATNNSTTGTTYLMEARAAARPYGYVNGQGNVTVDSAPTACPTGTTPGSTCYEAVITSRFPLSFSRVIGFKGSDNSGSQLINARAVATTSGGASEKEVCVWTLSGNANSFTSNGGPKPDMTGCTLFSNGGMTCSGHDLGADYGAAAGTSSGCGKQQVSGVTAPTDPYDGLAKANDLPSKLASCSSSFPQLTKQGNNWSVPAANQMTGVPTWKNTEKVFCGDVQLTGDVTLDSGTTSIIIENGRLDLNGHKLQTTSGAAATIVFSGQNNAAYSHYPMSTQSKQGTIDIKAPDTGAWANIAMYQDPTISTNTSFTYAGNEPTWNITGTVYLPHADVTFSGVVNKASNGTSCFVLIAYSVLVNGTGTIFANTDCKNDGPSVTIGSSTRPKLVT